MLEIGISHTFLRSKRKLKLSKTVYVIPVGVKYSVVEHTPKSEKAYCELATKNLIFEKNDVVEVLCDEHTICFGRDNKMYFVNQKNLEFLR